MDSSNSPITKVCVFTAPRSGTHFLVRSISHSLTLPFFIPYEIGLQFPKEESWVVGSHSAYHEPLKNRLVNKGVKLISLKRDELDTLLSCLAFSKFDLLPNSKELLTSSFLAKFKRHLDDVNNWALHSLVLDYEALIDSSHEFHLSQKVRLEELLGHSVLFESLSQIRNANSLNAQGTRGTPNGWKEMLSKDSVLNLCSVLGLNPSKYTSTQQGLASEEGDLVFLSTYSKTLNRPVEPLHDPTVFFPPVKFH